MLQRVKPLSEKLRSHGRNNLKKVVSKLILFPKVTTMYLKG
jgi:hypothetical protein